MAEPASTLVARESITLIPGHRRIGPDPVLEALGVSRLSRSGSLRSVSVSLAPGQLIAVTGPANSGKSTLLSCLAGLDVADKGRILVGGKDLSKMSAQARARLRARSMGVMFQSGNLFSHLTLMQNVQLAPRPVGGDRHWCWWELLAEFGLAHRAMAYPAQLTPGEMVRAALAVALVNDPAVLLVDEPTAALDEDDEQLVIDALLRRVGKGLAVLVTSRSEAMLAVADRVVTLGRLTEPATGERDNMLSAAA